MKGNRLHFMLLLAVLIGCGCREEMRNDSRLKPLQEDPFFADRDSSRPLVPNTVPRGEADTDDFFYQGEISGKLVRGFPSRITKQELERGRDRFNIYCSVCHGPTGEADGMIVQRGFPQPPSFHEQRLRDAPEGHFFHVITQGYGVMYPYADRITPEDRWAIIAYIRALQLSRNSTINDVPPDQKARLNGP
jgi:cytochrome c553